MGIEYRLKATDKASRARLGEIRCEHGIIPTPVFMPVGTTGAVKGIHLRDMEISLDAKIILANTYHLYLRPGTGVIASAGGLHRFSNWKRPMLTDSGGYQVFSLAHRRKITEEGVRFQSHIDGSRHLFTPESTIDIQRIIGADIIMALDECPPYPAEKSYVSRSLDLTLRWLDRCRNHFNNSPPLYGHSQSLFPIIQGGVFPDLRIRSAEAVMNCPADGYAIGGLSVGEPAAMMYEITGLLCSILPQDKARYLMGVGTPANLLECISAGIDMFDCVMPTRNGRNGMIFTRKGIMNMKNEKWKSDHSPLDEDENCFADTAYSRSFIRHLFTSGEMLGPMIASLHNIAFYFSLMAEAREHILNGDFKAWKDHMVPQLEQRI